MAAGASGGGGANSKVSDRFCLTDPVLPQRELDVKKTVEALRRLRRDVGTLRLLSGSQLEDFAELCVPLAFERSQLLFGRGEPSEWLGVLLSGRAAAYLPGGGQDGEDLPLGTHSPGEVVGVSRTSPWQQEKRYMRAYSLKALEPGQVAVVSSAALARVARTVPALHLALQRALLAELADVAAGFFCGCPLSTSTRWPLVPLPERRLLELLVRLRDDKKLFSTVDYKALQSLSTRMRPTQWQAGVPVLARGALMSAAFVVLDGKLTGFSDPAGAPSAKFEAGDVLGLEGILGSTRPCTIDVFAARPTLMAVLVPEDLQDLGFESPAMASQVVHSLYMKLLSGLSAPHGRALLPLAEAADRIRFEPGQLPLYPLGRRPVAGGLTPEAAAKALKLLESSALVPGGPSVTAGVPAVPPPPPPPPRPPPLQPPPGGSTFAPGSQVQQDDAALRNLITPGKAAGQPAVQRDDAALQRLIALEPAPLPAAGGKGAQRDDAALARLIAPAAAAAPEKAKAAASPRSSAPGSSLGNFIAQKFAAQRAKTAGQREREAQRAAPRVPVAPPAQATGSSPPVAVARPSSSQPAAGRRSVGALSRTPWLRGRRGRGAVPKSPWALRRSSSAPPRSQWRWPEHGVDRAWVCPTCGSPLDAPGPQPTVVEAPEAAKKGGGPAKDGAKKGEATRAYTEEHHAWNLKVTSQQHQIEQLRAKIKEIGEENKKLRKEFDSVQVERDAWKAQATSLHLQLHRDFADAEYFGRRRLQAEAAGLLPAYDWPSGPWPEDREPIDIDWATGWPMD